MSKIRKAQAQKLTAVDDADVNYCDFGHSIKAEVRLLPTSTGPYHGNIIICQRHYSLEISGRIRAGVDNKKLLPTWNLLKTYTGA